MLLNATGLSIEIGDEVIISAGLKISSATYDKEAFIMNRERRHIGGVLQSAIMCGYASTR